MIFHNQTSSSRYLWGIWILMARAFFKFSIFGNINSAGRIWEVHAWMMATAASSTSISSTTTPQNVLVTGASGRTGQLVFGALLDDPRFEPKALVRSARSAKKLLKQVPKTRLDQIIISDVTSLAISETDSEDDIKKTIPPGLKGIDSMVVCTSAVPTISKASLLKALLLAPINLLRRRKAVDFRKLRFVWKYGHYPEKVDYHGQKAQIDLAKKLNIREIVLVSSMGGTDSSNFLNQVGKNADGTGNGDILLWKRKAEKYLVESGLDFVIIHPGGLIDTAPGQEDFVLDVNDKLVNNKKRSISRADVAKLCVAALVLDPSEVKNAINCPTPKDTSTNGSIQQTGGRKRISLDCVTQQPENGKPVRSAEEALKDFLQKSKIYDYSL